MGLRPEESFSILPSLHRTYPATLNSYSHGNGPWCCLDLFRWPFELSLKLRPTTQYGRKPLRADDMFHPHSDLIREIVCMIGSPARAGSLWCGSRESGRARN